MSQIRLPTQLTAWLDVAQYLNPAASAMREMLRKPDASVYRCSECGWTFPLTVTSDIQDYLQSRDAAHDFRRHRCPEFHANVEDQ